MNFEEQDFELGFALFKTPASFLMDASLIPCASFAVGDLGSVGVWLADILEVFILAGGLSLGRHSMGFRYFPNYFLIS